MTTPRSARAWVLVLAACLFLWNLWGNDLWAPDEPYFGEGAREMVVDGEWLVPHVGGEVSTDKPPLFFWLIALFSLPFGAVTSLTARLPSVLAALGTLVLTMRLGARTSGTRSGILAGVMLATTYMFWDKARWVQIDSLLCFLILGALSAFLSFRDGRLSGLRAGLLFWAACALAVLAKGPVGVLLPLGIAVLTLATDRDLGRWRQLAPVAGPLLFVGVLAPWLIAVTLWSDDYSVWGALREHFVERAAHGMHHLQPFWYYAQVVPYALLPWSFLLAGAMVLAWRRRAEPFDRFLLVWVLFVIVFFSISKEKRDLYILPAIPGMVLLCARLVAAICAWWPFSVGLRGGHLEQKWVTMPQGVIGGLLVAAGIFVPIATPGFDPALVGPGWLLAIVLVSGGGVILATALAGKALRTVQATAATLALAMLTTATFVYPALDAGKSGRALAQVVRDTTAESRAAGQPILSLGLGNVPRAVSFYSGGIYLDEVGSLEELEAHLPPGQDSYALVAERYWKDASADLKLRTETLYATRLSRKDIALVRVHGAASQPP